jgi:hypothetical protein
MVARRARSLNVDAAAMTAWGAVVATGAAVGWLLLAFDRHIVLPTPPILGEFGPGLQLGLVVPACTAAVLIASLPSISERLAWARLCFVAPLASLSWTVALALAEGTSGLTRGPSWNTEYLADVPRVRADPAAFLQTFTADIGQYGIHVRGHPPGMVLLLAGLDRLGLGGPGWEAALVVGLSATAPVAVMLVVRALVDETTARRACPFLVVTPAAIWIATSADALYMTVGAWAVALVVGAFRMRPGPGIAVATAGGVLGGLALLGSYGLVLLATVPVAVSWSYRHDIRAVVRSIVTSTGASFAVLLALLPFGFSWVDGLRATMHEYHTLDLDRPYAAFLVVNLAAWSLAIGPATYLGLFRLRDRRLWTLVGGGLAAVALANVSGLSSGEVERIWLPFTLWVLPACAVLATDRRATRRFMGLQAAAAIGLVAVVTTQW